jgi:phosphatidylserine/phosphatidylglycerophosphate/cardiolipin synthase-like enzyme
MSFLPPLLLAQIRTCAKQIPSPVLEAVIDLLRNSPAQYCDFELKALILKQLPNANFRRLIGELLETWCREAVYLDSSAIATALSTASYCEEAAKDELSVELVWTGPTSEGMLLRKTEQVLLQVIWEAQQELILVSFAVYKIPKIAKALVNAINRGVRVRIIVETPEASEGKIPFGASAALGQEIAQQAQFFIWPRDKRWTDSQGRYGSLHIKCAIADRKHLFISSANLTEYALTLNMEMGLLVHGQDLAHKVAEHIERLIQEKFLVLIPT